MTTPSEALNRVEWIRDSETILALIIPGDISPSASTFITPDDYKQQVGFIVYPEGGEIIPHLHVDMDRKLTGTSEVLLVRKGLCWVDFYRQDQSYLESRKIAAGDVLILVSGGHGFRMIEDTTFIEVKQGPYLGEEEKVRFDRPEF